MWLDNKRYKVQIGDNKVQFESSGNRPGAWTEVQTTRRQKYNAMAGTNTDALTETRLSAAVVYLEAVFVVYLSAVVYLEATGPKPGAWSPKPSTNHSCWFSAKECQECCHI